MRAMLSSFVHPPFLLCPPPRHIQCAAIPARPALAAFTALRTRNPKLALVFLRPAQQCLLGLTNDQDFDIGKGGTTVLRVAPRLFFPCPLLLFFSRPCLCTLD